MSKRPNHGRGAGLQRTFRLVGELLKGEVMGAAEAARLLCINEPAARKQLQNMARLLPGLTSEKTTGRTVWRFTAPATTWDHNAAIAASIGSSLAPLFKGTRYGEALDELRTTLVDHNARKDWFQNIERKFWFVQQGGDLGISRRGSPLDDILTGLLQERHLQIENKKFGGEKESVTVAPLSIVLHQHQLYLLAKKNDDTLHTYRLSRIKKATSLEKFSYPTARQFSPEQVFKDSFGIWIPDEKAVDVELRLDTRWSTFVAHHQWHPSQRVDSSGGQLRVRLHCALCPELAQWILAFGEDAEVCTPPALREKIATKVRLMHERYSSREGVVAL